MGQPISTHTFQVSFNTHTHSRCSFLTHTFQVQFQHTHFNTVSTNTFQHSHSNPNVKFVSKNNQNQNPFPQKYHTHPKNKSLFQKAPTLDAKDIASIMLGKESASEIRDKKKKAKSRKKKAWYIFFSEFSSKFWTIFNNLNFQ